MMKLDSGCAGCYAGMSCQTRIAIINLLEEQRELNVSAIAKQFEVTQPTITHHLKYLEEAGILQAVKRGRQVFYSIHPKCGKEICNIFS